VRPVPSLRFLRALFATNLKASLALRGAFWLQAAFMLMNDLIWFSVWWIFFDRFQEIGGWRIADMTALYGIVAASVGIAVVFGGGVRDLAKKIEDGDLDPFLTQPKDAMLHVVGSRMRASGWGDLVCGIAFLSICGYVRPATIPLAALAVLCGAVVLLSTAVILNSLAFWLGPVDSLARQVWEFAITFSMYPQPLFAGALQMLLFTALPAAFIGWVPVSLLRDFSLGGLAAALGGTVAYALLAVGVFRAGLRRYASGSRFAVRA
jgi:ABC-2 type transport system permease protein